MKLHLTYEFESEEELRSHLSVETRAVTAVTAPALTPVVEEPVADIRSATDVDADQMPYDAAIHADPPQFTGDGLWRAKRGKSDEAKTARAAFKARGGAVVPPVVVVETAPSMPGLAAPVAAPTLPGLPGLPADAPEPITMERLIEKITGMFTRNVVTEVTLAGMYVKHGGQNDPAAAFGVFNTNESARAGLYAELCQIEPDLK